MLTEKQKLFCLEYIKNFNATQAYLNVYQSSTYKSARTLGPKLLTNVGILAYIDELKKEATNELKVEVKDIITNLTKIAFSDMGDYVEFGNKKQISLDNSGNPIVHEGKILMEEKNYVTVKDSKKVDTALITEIQNSKAGFKIKLADKLKALGMLLEYFNYSNVSAEAKEAKTFIINYPVESKNDEN